MTSSAIPDRVERLLPLLGSDKPGEVTNACRAILRDLGSVGLDWHDVLIVRRAPNRTQPPFARAPMPTFFDMARACRDLDQGRLTLWERDFVLDMCRYGRSSPSPRQAQRLATIFAQVRRRAA